MTLMETNTAMNRNDAAGDPLAVARGVLLEPHGLDVKDLKIRCNAKNLTYS